MILPQKSVKPPKTFSTEIASFGVKKNFKKLLEILKSYYSRSIFLVLNLHCIFTKQWFKICNLSKCLVQIGSNFVMKKINEMIKKYSFSQFRYG